MSYTGGYDVCIELGDGELTARASAALAGMVEEAGQNFERDVALNHPAGDDVLQGNLHVFAAGLRMRSLESADAEVEAVLRFERSALRLEQGSIDELAGEVTLSGAPVTVLSTSTEVKLIFGFYSSRSATIRFRDADAVRVNELLRRAGIDEAEGMQALADAALDHARELLTIVETPLTLAPDGEDGDLAELRFVEVDVRTRALPDGSGGALCLLANLLQSSKDRKPDRANKSEVGLRRGSTSAVALDEAAVRGLVFCPGALLSLLPRWLDGKLGDGFLRDLPADAFDHRGAETREAIRARIENGDETNRRDAYRLILGGDADGFERRVGPVIWRRLEESVRAVLRTSAAATTAVLPPPCGEGGVAIGDARLAHLDLLLGDGLATLTGHAFSTSPLVDGRIDFRHDVRLVVAERTRDGTTTTELDLVGLGQPTVVSGLAQSYLAVELGVATLGIATAIIDAGIRAAPNTTRRALRDAVNAFAAPDLPSDLGAVTGAAIRPQAIVVSFLARVVPEHFRVVFPSLAIDHDEHRARGTAGPRTAMQLDDRCHRGRYHYRDVEMTTQWTLRPRPTELTAPLVTTWILAGRELADGDGVLTLSGGLVLRYLASSGTLVVRNDPGSADFNAMVSCRTVDKDGLRAAAAPITLRFVGMRRAWEDPYNEEARACIEASLEDFRGAAERPGPTRGIGPITIDRLRRALVRNRDLDPVPLRALDTLLRRNATLAALTARSAPRRGPG